MVSWNPPISNKNDAAFNVTVKIKLDAFFGDPTETYVAVNYKLGSYVIYKGQKIYTSTLPEDIKKKITFYSVDIAFDIQNNQGKIVSTKTVGNVVTNDFPGSPNWDKMFPGLSAQAAKDLYKAGYSIVNVRITKASLSVPNLDEYVTGGVKPPTNTDATIDWEQVQYARKGDSVFIKKANGTILKYKICSSGSSSTNNGNNNNGNGGNTNSGSLNPNLPINQQCITPTISAEAATYCLKFMWSSCPNVGIPMTSEGKPLAKYPEYKYVIIQYRKQGDTQWKSLKGPGGCVLPKNALTETGVEPCTRYEYRIQAICDDNTMSEMSTTGSITTNCAAPNTLRAVNISSTSVDITFLITNRTASAIFSNTCHENKYEAYTVEYSSDSGMTWNTFDYTNGGLKITNLQPDTNYRVRMKTKFSNGKYSVYSSTINFRTLK